MKKLLVLTAAAALSASALAPGAAANLKATMPGDAYDCTTVSVTADGAELDSSDFTAASNDSGGCTLTFTKKVKSYTASVTDANGKLQKFKLVNGKLVNVVAKGAQPDMKALQP